MPRKKRSGKRVKPQRDRRAESLPFDLSPPFVPRALERLMREVLEDAVTETGITDQRDPQLIEAENTVFLAYDELEPERRGELARQALQIHPHCAEAYICLAELARSPDEAAAYYQQAIQAGETVLGGSEGLARYGDRLWSAMEARPYLQAQMGLGEALWASGQEEAALQRFCQLLQLDPSDHQGVRYLLCLKYSLLEDDQRLAELLEAHPDDGSAEWLFGRALLAFRQSGDSPRARSLLEAAHQTNPLVAEFLLGNRDMAEESEAVDELDDEGDWGGDTEALCYAENFLPCWRGTLGALPWLRKSLHVPLPEPPQPRRTPPRLLATRVAELPQVIDDAWQVDMLRAPVRASEGSSKPPWMLIATSSATGRALKLEWFEGRQPSPRDVLSTLLEAMWNPCDQEPRRPERIQVRRKSYLNAWQSTLQSLEIPCELCAALPDVDAVHEDLADFRQRSCENINERIGELKTLPQIPGEVWQADSRLLATWITGTGAPQRPTTALVVELAGEFILSQKLSLDQAAPDVLWEAVLSAMLSPAVDAPRRPAAIHVRTAEFSEVLRQRLESLGVECVVDADLTALDGIYDELEQSLSSHPTLSLIDTPGVKPAQVAAFFDAAADFYASRPWRDVAADTPIRICCQQWRPNTWYGVVMGQFGTTFGLALYEDLPVLQALLRQEADAERKQSGLSTMYGEAFDISARDLAVAEKEGWAVAAPEAYPIIIRINPGMAIRPPLAWELQLAEACLRAVPGFLTRQATGAAKMIVPTASGQRDLELSWLDSRG